MLSLYVGIGGIIGALLRYYLGLWSADWNHTLFPTGTFASNITGSFILGWFTTRIIQQKVVHPDLATAFGTGVIGSFTTFSTFSVETVQLIRTGHWQIAFLYVFFSLIGGFLMTWIGFRLGKMMPLKKKARSKQI